MSYQPNWGITTTVKAPTRDILNFVAFHLDQGADQITLYLDAPNVEVAAALESHPKCRTILTDDKYWQAHGYRPIKHRVRQQLNATHCLGDHPQVDWLAHIDADEFIWHRASSLSDQLASLPKDILSAHMRPIEALAADPDDQPPEGAQWFKSCNPDPRPRHKETAAIYPKFGAHLIGGFLSHVQGKVLVRTGQPDTALNIHRATMAGDKIKPALLPGTWLCHRHAPSFEEWQEYFAFRLAQGTYRKSRKPAPGSTTSLHSLFCQLERDGTQALRAFYHECCTANPALRARLKRYGHLHLVALDLDRKCARYFPDFI